MPADRLAAPIVVIVVGSPTLLQHLARQVDPYEVQDLVRDLRRPRFGIALQCPGDGAAGLL